MSKRIALKSEHLTAWHTHALDGRCIVVVYDTAEHDSDDACQVAHRLIPRGWKVAHDRPHQLQAGRYVLPIRRATRTVGH